jgi:streptogramin lyase
VLLVALATPAGALGPPRAYLVQPIDTSAPLGIAAGPDRRIWYTKSGTDAIGRKNVQSPFAAGVDLSVPLPAGSTPWWITAGPDGNMWFTERDGNRIGRVTPAGVVTGFPIPTAGSQPTGIVAGRDGNLWFTELAGNKIGRITPAGVITEFPIPTAGSQPMAIALGADGELWFTESAGNKIGRITRGGVITEFTVPTAAVQPWDIAAGPDGALWFTEHAANKVGRITTAGVITEFGDATLSPSLQPAYLAAGPDGLLWVTERNGRIVSALSPDGVVRARLLTVLGTSLEGGGIAAGPGGLWLTDPAVGKIWQLPVAGEPGDVNGDGRADLVAGAGPGGGPHLRVLSGLTGAALVDVFPYAAAFTGGITVAACDLDGDGRAELITGPGPGGGPHVRALKLRTFYIPTGPPFFLEIPLTLPTAFLDFFPYAPAFAGGVWVGCGDVDGDGVPDIVTGPGAGGGPDVRAFAGDDATLIYQNSFHFPGFLGGVFVGP